MFYYGKLTRWHNSNFPAPTTGLLTRSEKEGLGQSIIAKGPVQLWKFKLFLNRHRNHKRQCGEFRDGVGDTSILPIVPADEIKFPLDKLLTMELLNNK